MKNKVIAVLSVLLICFTGITAFASSDDTAATVTPSRTISTEGTGHVVDNISDGDKLQFISVTAKDGSVFFVVIDKANTNDNVYFLNKVDVSDLEALAKDYKAQPAAVTPTPQPEAETDASPSPEEHKDDKPKQTGNNSNGMLIVLLLLAAAGGAGAYYFKVVLPKKKYQDADELGDFEFVDDDGEETEPDDTDEEPDEADYE